jgi:glucan biosynthesis protein C
VLYVGKRYLNFSNNMLIYAEEIVLPFYLLHYLVVTILTFYLVQLNTMMVATFLLSSTSSLVVTTILCDLLVRRNNVTPWLFGMKPQRHGA